MSLSSRSIHSSSTANPSRLISKASTMYQMLFSPKGRLQGLEGAVKGPLTRPKQWIALLFTSEPTVSTLQHSRCSSSLATSVLKLSLLCKTAPHLYTFACLDRFRPCGVAMQLHCLCSTAWFMHCSILGVAQHGKNVLCCTVCATSPMCLLVCMRTSCKSLTACMAISIVRQIAFRSICHWRYARSAIPSLPRQLAQTFCLAGGSAGLGLLLVANCGRKLYMYGRYDVVHCRPRQPQW